MQFNHHTTAHPASTPSHPHSASTPSNPHPASTPSHPYPASTPSNPHPASTPSNPKPPAPLQVVHTALDGEESESEDESARLSDFFNHRHLDACLLADKNPEDKGKGGFDRWMRSEEEAFPDEDDSDIDMAAVAASGGV